MGRPKGSRNKPKSVGPCIPLPIPAPRPTTNATNHTVQWGLPINPVARLSIMGSGDWEDFIREWAESLKSEYHDVQRIGGSGDQGRDVIAYLTDQPTPWVNYQCKHYGAPLAPADAYLELGKLCYYTFINEYTLPNRYYFVAPKGVGTSLGKLIEKPQKLRAQLIANWTKYCETEITDLNDVKLEGEFLTYVEDFDFSIIKRISAGKIIEQHRSTPYHVLRFGGGLPPRPEPDAPPSTIAPAEARYVTQLIEAYGEHVGRSVTSLDEFTGKDAKERELAEHFQRCREHFYCAESLRNFSRELLPDNEFAKLQDDVYDGVVDTCLDDHHDGYTRVKETVKAARGLHLTSHTLITCTRPRDLSGICHQLANDDRLKWVRKP